VVNPRLMRLQSDYRMIQEEFAGNPHISVEPVSRTVPPEKYIVTFRVPGLCWDSRERCAVVTNHHRAEIYLHTGYPREKPKCVLTTPVWHPNFGTYICIGDHWAAGETLVDVIVQIADMLQYRTYNPRSPLNAAAARWAMSNRNRFPIGHINVRRPDPDFIVEGMDRPHPDGGRIGVENASRQSCSPTIRKDYDLGIVLRSPSVDDTDITFR